MQVVTRFSVSIWWSQVTDSARIYIVRTNKTLWVEIHHSGINRHVPILVIRRVLSCNQISSNAMDFDEFLALDCSGSLQVRPDVSNRTWSFLIIWNRPELNQSGRDGRVKSFFESSPSHFKILSSRVESSYQCFRVESSRVKFFFHYFIVSLFR
jgi:hypothetical protein